MSVNTLILVRSLDFEFIYIFMLLLKPNWQYLPRKRLVPDVINFRITTRDRQHMGYECVVLCLKQRISVYQ